MLCSPREATPIFEFVYTSVLAPHSDVRSIADIIRRSRSYNRAHGITGILIFDGERFCQYLEGDGDAVLLLARKIEADRRHSHFAIVQQGFRDEPRRFPEWDMAYAQDTRGMVVEALTTLRGPDAAEFLRQRVPDLEMQPPIP